MQRLGAPREQSGEALRETRGQPNGGSSPAAAAAEAPIAEQLLALGLVDQIDIHVAPVLLGDGIPLYDAPGASSCACGATVPNPPGPRTAGQLRQYRSVDIERSSSEMRDPDTAELATPIARILVARLAALRAAHRGNGRSRVATRSSSDVLLLDPEHTG